MLTAQTQREIMERIKKIVELHRKKMLYNTKPNRQAIAEAKKDLADFLKEI